MKYFRKKWDKDIVKFIYELYENTYNVCCEDCPFFINIYVKKIYKVDLNQYVDTPAKETINFDKADKKCKNTCIFYY